MKSYIAIIISLIAVVLVFSGGTQLGGYTAGHWDSGDGYKVDGTTVIDDSGDFIGTINTDNAATITNTLTLDESSSSTLKIGTDGKTGCLEMGEESTGGTVYVTVSSSTISATTNQPSICK